MPSNVTLNPGAAGAIAATKQISHDGDTAQVQMMGIFGLSGTEDAYTATLVNADANGLHVSVRAVLPGTTATSLGKAEDDAAASGDVGVAALTVRQDTPTSSTSADGDYQNLKTDSVGRLWTAAVQSGTWSVGITGGSVGLLAGAANIGNVGVNSIAAGDNNIGNVDVVTLPALPAGNNNIGDVDVASVIPGVGGINLGKAEDGAHVSGDVGVMALGVRRDAGGTLASGDGDYTPFTTDSAGAIWVRVTNGVIGATHDSAAAAEGVQQMLEARNSSPTAVANGDAVRGIATLDGKQVTQPYAIPENTWRYAAASGGIVNTTGVNAKAAAGVGIRNYITGCDFVNGHATTSTDFQIRDGAAGTVMYRGWAQAAGGGAALKFDPPLQGTANTLVEIACGTTGAAVYANLRGYVGP